MATRIWNRSFNVGDRVRVLWADDDEIGKYQGQEGEIVNHYWQTGDFAHWLFVVEMSDGKELVLNDAEVERIEQRLGGK